MKLKVGLVGLGPSWMSRHRPALRALSDRFEVRAVCDPIAHRAQQVAEEWKAVAMDSYRAVARREDIDALLFLSARWFGPLPIISACEYGKAVYCGASVDIEAAEAARLRHSVREAGIAFMAEFPKRLAPATIRLQELMATRLGRPRLLFCNQRLTQPSSSPMPQDISMRHLVEMVDWCRYLTGGEALRVVGSPISEKPQPSQEEYLSMTVEFGQPESAEPGPVAQISCGSYVPAPWQEAASFRRPADLQIVCESGIAFVDLPSTLVWFDQAGQHTESLGSERPVGEQLLMHFHRAVESLVLKTSSLEDAYRAMAVVIAARESGKRGERIDCNFDS